MSLYVKNNGNLDVYNLTPKSEEIKKYKQTEMKKIEETERVFKAVTNEEFEAIFPLAYKETVFASELDYKSCSFFDEHGHIFKRYFHKLESYNHPNAHIYRANVLNIFYNELYDKIRLVKVLEDRNKGIWKVEDLKTIQYLLITQKKYKKDINGKKVIYTMDRIINIPETLYYLEKLKQGNYSEVIGKNIDDQLSLFELSAEPSYSINLDELASLEQNGIVQNVIGEEQLETSSEIIRKIKAINK